MNRITGDLRNVCRGALIEVDAADGEKFRRELP